MSTWGIPFYSPPLMPRVPGTQSPPYAPEGNALYTQMQKDLGELYTQDINGASVPMALQGCIGQRKVGLFNAQGNSTTVSLMGLAATAAGTATARTVATTNLGTSLRRVGYVSAATAGASAGIRNNALQWSRGNFSSSNYDGGVIMRARFVLGQVQAGMRWLVGLSATAGAFANADPSTFLNFVGFGVDAADANISLMHNDGAGTATKQGTGIDGRTVNSVFDIFIGAVPRSTSWECYINRLDNGQYAEDNFSADMPASSALLSYQLWINNGATAAAVAIDPSIVYLETNY